MLQEDIDQELWIARDQLAQNYVKTLNESPIRDLDLRQNELIMHQNESPLNKSMPFRRETRAYKAMNSTGYQTHQQDVPIQTPCTSHNFCIKNAPDSDRHIENFMIGPEPVLALKKPASPNGTNSRQYALAQPASMNDERRLEPGQKVVVTEIALDDWLAQQYGLDLENLPYSINTDCPLRDAYEKYLKKYYKYTKEKEAKALAPSVRRQLFPNFPEELYPQPVSGRGRPKAYVAPTKGKKKGSNSAQPPKQQTDEPTSENIEKRQPGNLRESSNDLSNILVEDNRSQINPSQFQPLTWNKDKQIKAFVLDMEDQNKNRNQNQNQFNSYNKGKRQTQAYNDLPLRAKKLITRIAKVAGDHVSRSEIFTCAKRILAIEEEQREQQLGSIDSKGQQQQMSEEDLQALKEQAEQLKQALAKPKLASSMKPVSKVATNKARLVASSKERIRNQIRNNRQAISTGATARNLRQKTALAREAADRPFSTDQKDPTKINRQLRDKSQNSTSVLSNDKAFANKQQVPDQDESSMKEQINQPQIQNIKSILKSPASSTIRTSDNRLIDSKAIDTVQKRVKARALFNHMIERQCSQSILKRLREGEAKRSVFMNILQANKSERRYVLPRDPSTQLLSQQILQAPFQMLKFQDSNNILGPSGKMKHGRRVQSAVRDSLTYMGSNGSIIDTNPMQNTTIIMRGSQIEGNDLLASTATQNFVASEVNIRPQSVAIRGDYHQGSLIDANLMISVPLSPVIGVESSTGNILIQNTETDQDQHQIHYDSLKDFNPITNQHYQLRTCSPVIEEKTIDSQNVQNNQSKQGVTITSRLQSKDITSPKDHHFSCQPMNKSQATNLADGQNSIFQQQMLNNYAMMQQSQAYTRSRSREVIGVQSMITSAKERNNQIVWPTRPSAADLGYNQGFASTRQDMASLVTLSAQPSYSQLRSRPQTAMSRTALRESVSRQAIVNIMQLNKEAHQIQNETPPDEVSASVTVKRRTSSALERYIQRVVAPVSTIPEGRSRIRATTTTGYEKSTSRLKHAQDRRGQISTGYNSGQVQFMRPSQMTSGTQNSQLLTRALSSEVNPSSKNQQVTSAVQFTNEHTSAATQSSNLYISQANTDAIDQQETCHESGQQPIPNVSKEKRDIRVLEKLLKHENADTKGACFYQINHRRVDQIAAESSYIYLSQMQNDVNTDPLLGYKAKLSKLKVMKDADYWFTKGAHAQAEGKIHSSIDCYKQAILINDKHFPAFFNLATCYENLNKFECSNQQFFKVIELNPKLHRAYVGAALNCLKTGLDSMAYDLSTKAAEIVEQEIEDTDAQEPEIIQHRSKSNSLHAMLRDYFYIRALAKRQMKELPEAEKLYLEFINYFRYEQRNDTVEYTFGILMMCLMDDRRKFCSYLENLLDTLKNYSMRNQPIKQPLFLNFYRPKDIYYGVKEGWIPETKELALEFIQQRPFFKRFSLDQLRPFQSKMRVEQLKVDQFLFPDFKVAIILAGNVECFRHIDCNRIAALTGRYGEGDILGAPEIDDGATSDVESWCRCLSAAEVIWMPKKDFLQLYDLQQKSPKMIQFNLLKCQPLFRQFTDVTLKMMAFELMQTKEFLPGDLICKQTKRSTVNEQFSKYYGNNADIVEARVAKLKENADQIGCDKHSSNFTLMIKEVVVRGRQEDEELKRMNALRMKRKDNNESTIDSNQQTLSDRDQKALNDKNKEISESLIGKKLHSMKYVTKAVAQSKMIDRTQLLNAYREKNGNNGVYIIESGRCQIVNTMSKEKSIFTELQRGDHFGIANQLKLVGLEYFGDVVALGGENSEQNDDNLGHDFDNKPQRVRCFYFTHLDFRKIPAFELQKMIEPMNHSVEKYVSMAARKFNMDKETLRLY